MEHLPLVPTPRVMLARESIWRMPVPNDPTQRPVLLDRRGDVVLSAYAVYSDAAGIRDFEGYVQPVLRTLASSRSQAVLALVMSPATFDAGLLRHALGVARDLAIPSMVEIREMWGKTMLELLALAGPTYLRLPPEFLRGAGSVPDVFRALVSFAEFARERRLAVVARNLGDAQELDAARVAGIELVQWGGVPILDDHVGVAAFPSLVR